MDQQHFRTPIGDMRVIEVFLYYDGPKLFSCKDRTGQKYIAMLVDESEDGDRWFLVPVSNTRLERVHSGELGLRECVRYPENDWLWDVFIPYDGSKGDARLKYASTLQEDELPGPRSDICYCNVSTHSVETTPHTGRSDHERDEPGSSEAGT